MKKILFTLTVIFSILNGKGQVRLYGLTYYIGNSNWSGSVFHYTPSSATHTVDHSMNGSVDGVAPNGALTLSGGKFYGMAQYGGANGVGVIFEWDPEKNIYTKKIDLTDNTGARPSGSLKLSGGKFYGMTPFGGSYDLGVIFEWDPVTNIYTKKIDFNGINGNNPYGTLTLQDGKFYGTTSYGGVNGVGVIFEWDPVTNIYTKKIDFNNNDIHTPVGLGSLVFNGGKFYGMTSFDYYGITDVGGIFEWDPITNTCTKKIDFDNSKGKWPNGTLALRDGTFYGTTSRGGASDNGVIFEWDPVTNIYTKKIDLNGMNGANPSGSLTFTGGKFYGTTPYGGVSGVGVIFEWDPVSNMYAKSLDFNNANGSYPFADLVEYDPDPIPAISIADRSITEGNDCIKLMNFEVVLSNASTGQVSVKYATANGTATVIRDYLAANGTVKFKSGQTIKTIRVLIKGDIRNEPDENFQMILSQPVNANIADGLAIGTIKNDDLATFSIGNYASDVSKENGARPLIFQVSPNPAKSKVTVSGLSAGAANHIELSDMNGRSLLKQKVTSNVQTIDLTKYAGGIYVLRYFNGSNWQQIKVVKQ